eukprot:12894012-Prorocentrum_lima.AAC.1
MAKPQQEPLALRVIVNNFGGPVCAPSPSCNLAHCYKHLPLGVSLTEGAAVLGDFHKAITE